MESSKKEVITVDTTVQKPVEKVWECWTNPKHITQWSNASDDWHAPKAENDLRAGGN
ncbi:SRPBCC domain-containing protein, partial [Staphylococcus sp. SIMBA_130]